MKATTKPSLAAIAFVLSFVINTVTAYAVEKKFTPFSPDEIEVSSFLKEGKTEYSKECLSPKISRPWVPAGGNNGIGESITLKDCTAMDIYISIGYVSKERPDLYYKNSRPKKIRARFLETGKTKEFSLKDTSEPQQLRLIDSEAEFLKNPRNTVTLTFPEVYEGTKYKDLCVNFIGVNNVFSGQKFEKMDERDGLAFEFGADSAEYYSESGDEVERPSFRKIRYKYAHNKELNRLYLIFDKVVFTRQDELLDKDSALAFIHGKQFRKISEYYYRDDYTEAQWNGFQNSIAECMKIRFETPIIYELDIDYYQVELFPVTIFFDERLFSSLVLENSIRIGSCGDTILSDGFWITSTNVPNRNSEPEHYDANYVLMKEMNKAIGKDGYYAFAVGFANPAVIKYRISGKIDGFSWQKYTFDFVYPDGSKQTGYLDPNAIVFYPKEKFDPDYLPKNAMLK